VSASKQPKGARAGDPKNQKQEHEKAKLIRLDDLIPKQNVRGGRQLIFGATDTNPTTTHKKKEN
jgi:hypothetical protein